MYHRHKYKVGDVVSNCHAHYKNEVLTITELCPITNILNNPNYKAKSTAGVILVWSEYWFTGLVNKKSTKSPLPNWW